MKFKIMIDSVKYTDKPKNDVPAIKSRLAKSCSTPQDCTPDSLKAVIESGGTFCPATIRPTLNDKGEISHQAAGFEQQQVFGIDIDNDFKSKETGKKERLPDGEYLPHDNALEMCDTYGIKPFMLYHSFSNTAAIEKYRLLVCLDTPITDNIERERIQKAFVSLFGRAADASCANADRIFFGSTPSSVFYTDNDAITPKSVFLDIAKAKEDTERAERAETAAVQRAMKKAGSQAAYEAAKDHRFDAKPEALLSLIPVGDPNRAEWVRITAAYKNSDGDRTTWDTWNSGYVGDNEKHDAKTWETCGKSGKNGACGIGTLKYYAKQLNPTGYQNYIDDLNAQQRAARQGSAGKTAQKKQPPQTAPADKEGFYTLKFTDGTSLTVPNWIKVSQNGKFQVSPSYLEELFRKNYPFIYTQDGDISGHAVYAYSPKAGVYLFQDSSTLMAACKKLIDSYNRKAERKDRVDNYTKALHETVELLTTMHPQDTHKPYDLDSKETFVNFTNGMYNMETGEMQNHSPEFLSTIQIPTNYTPGSTYTLEKDAPTFCKYLNHLTDGDEDRKTLLLEYAGVCFSNIDGSRYKRFLYLIGAGDSGKSQYVRLIAEIIGDRHAASTDITTLDDRFQNAKIVGKRFVFDSDSPDKIASGNRTLMLMTGGDYIPIERKGAETFNYRFRGLVVACSNQMPRTHGNLSQAFYNRFLICQCPKPVPKAQQDKYLLDKMLKEKDAIISICLEYAKKTVERGYAFTIPQDNTAFIDEIKAENDPISEFLQDYCKLYDPKTDGERITRPSFYRIFVQWYTNTRPRRTPPSSRALFKKICEFFNLETESRKSHGVYYCEVTLTQDARNELLQGSQAVDGVPDIDSF